MSINYSYVFLGQFLHLSFCVWQSKGSNPVIKRLSKFLWSIEATQKYWDFHTYNIFETWAPTTCVGIGSLNVFGTIKKLSIHIKYMNIVCFQFLYIIYVCYNLHMYVIHITTISLQNVNFTSIIWKWLKDYINIIKKKWCLSICVIWTCLFQA
jgi:hypothetical protein